jgi:ABC-type iron transport system FetAB permease component
VFEEDEYRRLRFAASAFVLGFVLVLLFVVASWGPLIAVVGFVTMIGSALVIYRFLEQLDRDQVRQLRTGGGIERLAARLRSIIHRSFD